MQKKIIFGGALSAMLLVSGCHKEPYGGGGGLNGPVGQFIAQSRAAAEQTTLINAANGGVMFGSKGTIITFAPNAFRTHNGGQVNGNVTVRLLEAYSPGDMVGLNMQTVAMVGMQKVALQSGGEVRYRADANGQQVTVSPGAAVIHFPNDQPDPLMREFRGQEDNGAVLWEEAGELAQDTAVVFLDSAGGQGWLPGNYYSSPWPANSYNQDWPDYGYMNCDHPLPPGGDSTDVTVLWPGGSEDGYTTVWIVLPGINCMVYMEQPVTNGIRAGFPIRVGLQGTIVALRIDNNGQYYSAFEPVTITAGMQHLINLQPTTQAQYQQALQAL